MMKLMKPKRRTVPPRHRPIPTVLNLKPSGAILKSLDYQRDANGRGVSINPQSPAGSPARLDARGGIGV